MSDKQYYNQRELLSKAGLAEERLGTLKEAVWCAMIRLVVQDDGPDDSLVVRATVLAISDDSENIIVEHGRGLSEFPKDYPCLL